ncbi:MAG: hypothetical protein IJS20_07800 [Bacteroidales bacterium]|nr:hypothetical protein [Bacteroidales bacterium]
MSEINGKGLDVGGGKMPDSIDISGFGEYSPNEYAELIAEKISRQNTSHGVAELSSNTLGDTVTWADSEWIIVESLASTVVLALKYAADGWCGPIGMPGGDSSQRITYHTACNILKTYESRFSIERINETVEITDYLEGISTHFWLPTYADVNGGLSYFNSDTRRKFSTSGSVATHWWTITQNSYSTNYYVSTNGSISSSGTNYNNPASSMNYYRPFVTVYIA